MEFEFMTAGTALPPCMPLPPVLLLDDLMVDALQQRRFQRMGRSQKMPVCSV